MTHSDLRDRYVRVFAAAIGAFLVLALIAVSRPEGGRGGVLPASLSFLAVQDGVVAVAPVAPQPLLRSAALRPGGSARGHLVLRNQTGERLAVGLRAQPSSTALDGIVQVRILAGERVLADTTLQGLRDGSERRVRIAPGGAAKLDVTASIPAEVETGYEGRLVEVTLEPLDGGA